MLFFFFKQKTAYEVRISDWSSDVCSSDLPRRGSIGAVAPQRAVVPGHGRGRCHPGAAREPPAQRGPRTRTAAARPRSRQLALRGHGAEQRRQGPQGRRQGARSEEHTSELQSLMRISYAVFCLKKKKKSTLDS